MINLQEILFKSKYFIFLNRFCTILAPTILLQHFAPEYLGLGHLVPTHHASDILFPRHFPRDKSLSRLFPRQISSPVVPETNLSPGHFMPEISFPRTQHKRVFCNLQLSSPGNFFLVVSPQKDFVPQLFLPLLFFARLLVPSLTTKDIRRALHTDAFLLNEYQYKKIIISNTFM